MQRYYLATVQCGDLVSKANVADRSPCCYSQSEPSLHVVERKVCENSGRYRNDRLDHPPWPAPVETVGWPGGISPPGSHRTVLNSLPLHGSSLLILQNVDIQAQ